MDGGSDWYQDVAELEAHLSRRRGPSAALPTIVGYDVLREIRRGGQGVVYFGRQRSTRRVVAIKVMRDPALAVGTARRRFEREIELVTSLRHPNVVTVYDSGETDAHDPFFVMEFVDGVPLDEFIKGSRDRGIEGSRPSDAAAGQQAGAEPDGRESGVTRPRIRIDPLLELFAGICEAVAHAHQRGVIHRDLKPSNILIDERGQPRVLDFGVARVMPHAPGGSSSATASDAFLGTLAYASPEHVRDGAGAVDVRSDVYALGLILYEMLTGRLPYAASGPVGSVVQAILESEPRPPRTLGHASDADLDAIVLKALTKEPVRRYQSVDALAEDIRRYRRGELIHARRDSAIYVLRKLVRRNKAVTGLAVALILTISGFAVGMTVLYRRATLEGQTSRQIRVFLEDTLASVEPADSGRDVTLSEVLNEAVHWVELALADQPEVQSSVRHTLANSFRVLGDFGAAESQLEAALAIRRAHFGEASLEVAQSLGLMGLLELDCGKIGASVTTLRAALQLRRDLLGPDHPDVALTLQNLARALEGAGQSDAAEAALRDAIGIATRAYGAHHADTWMPQFRLAEVLARRGAAAEAERIHQTVLDGRRAHLPAGHPDVERSLLALGELLARTQRGSEAEALLRECLERRLSRLPPEHALVAEIREALDRCGTAEREPASGGSSPGP